jgi:hypothetical protein
MHLADVRQGRARGSTTVDGTGQTSRRRGRDRSRGQSLVEFTLILPVALMLLVAVGDMARLYMTMITVESAAREAADFGAYGSPNWDSPNRDATLAGMRARACATSRHLTGFVGTETDCTNPSMAVALLLPNGQPASSTSGCELPDRPGGPCKVEVQMDYRFELLVPLAIEVNGLRIGFPESVSFTRSSVFANSDFLVAS